MLHSNLFPLMLGRSLLHTVEKGLLCWSWVIFINSQVIFGMFDPFQYGLYIFISVYSMSNLPSSQTLMYLKIPIWIFKITSVSEYLDSKVHFRYSSPWSNTRRLITPAKKDITAISIVLNFGLLFFIVSCRAVIYWNQRSCRKTEWELTFAINVIENNESQIENMHCTVV